MSTGQAVPAIGAFTDTYLPTVNGVTYTLSTWRERWARRDGRMDVVYPRAEGHTPAQGEHPVTSLPFPFYDDFRIGVPSIPSAVADVDIVHLHTPFHVGFAGLRLANQRDLPSVASYHTPTSEYTNYIAPTERIASTLAGISRRWERWIFDRVDVVLAPSEATREHLLNRVGVESRIQVLSNGVDINRFQPVDATEFLATQGIDPDGSLIGYTGRHGFEKQLDELIEAAAGLDATVLVGGDGPARSTLEQLAADRDVDARFLGFLDREDLPAFYSSLDVFAFPSPVETQGLVAMEAMACGTPVVGADRGALTETIEEGATGYRYPSGDVTAFRDAITRALADRTRLAETCLDRRDAMAVDRTIDQLGELYRSLGVPDSDP